jgi:hypothetical protein
MTCGVKHPTRAGTQRLALWALNIFENKVSYRHRDKTKLVTYIKRVTSGHHHLEFLFGFDEIAGLFL